MKTTQLTASGDVKAYGGPGKVLWITVSNNGTAGVAGEVELREAVSPAGDGGTLRWSRRFDSADETAFHHEFRGQRDGDHGIDFSNGIRFTMDTVTNLIVTIGWEG